jgi:hypothetical protein
MAPVPQQFSSAAFLPLLAFANAYNMTNNTTYPVMAERVARKESLIANMASEIEGHIPLALAPFAFSMGLRAGFSRSIGETADPHFGVFGALAQFAATAGPTDYNLKHQVVRAYLDMAARFPSQSRTIATAVKGALPVLTTHADGPLTTRINLLKSGLGI